MSIGSKMKTIGENLIAVYDTGFAKGESHGQAACQAVHYTDVVKGSGTRRMEFLIPFQPDLFSVYSTSHEAEQVAGSFRGMLIDFRGCGTLVGNVLAVVAGGAASAAVTPALAALYFRYENGVLIFEPPADKLTGLLFRENAGYSVTAVKYPQESGGVLLRKQIASLPDQVPQGRSSTLTYNRAAVERYMTPKEWEELIATKPNWTFVMT